MDIKVTDCTTRQPIYLAAIDDIYGNSSYTDSSGLAQIVPGTEGDYYGTLVSIRASNYTPQEFTLQSYGENDFCLQPVAVTGTGTGTAGGYGSGIY